MDALQHRLDRAQLALPDHERPPAEFTKLGNVFCVTIARAGKLRLPVVQIGLRQSSDRAIRVRMPMPETAVHEDHGAVFGQREVWFAGQVGAVQPESVAHPMSHRSDGKFRRHVLRTDAGHAVRALFWSKIITHAIASRASSASRLINASSSDTGTASRRMTPPRRFRFFIHSRNVSR